MLHTCYLPGKFGNFAAWNSLKIPEELSCSLRHPFNVFNTPAEKYGKLIRIQNVNLTDYDDTLSMTRNLYGDPYIFQST